MIWYVDPKIGSDAHDGRSMKAPFKSVAHAVSVASPCDKVLIAPGAYEQDLPQQVSAARARDLTVTVAGSE